MKTVATCASILLLVLLPGVAHGQQTIDHFGMPEPRYEIRMEPSVRIPMSDGVRLSTDLYFPVGASGPLPVVLIRTPYDKNRFRPERSSGYYR